MKENIKTIIDYQARRTECRKCQKIFYGYLKFFCDECYKKIEDERE